jgi:hypothetical protein
MTLIVESAACTMVPTSRILTKTKIASATIKTGIVERRRNLDENKSEE